MYIRDKQLSEASFFCLFGDGHLVGTGNTRAVLWAGVVLVLGLKRLVILVGGAAERLEGVAAMGVRLFIPDTRGGDGEGGVTDHQKSIGDVGRGGETPVLGEVAPVVSQRRGVNGFVHDDLLHVVAVILDALHDVVDVIGGLASGQGRQRRLHVAFVLLVLFPGIDELVLVKIAAKHDEGVGVHLLDSGDELHLGGQSCGHVRLHFDVNLAGLDFFVVTMVRMDL